MKLLLSLALSFGLLAETPAKRPQLVTLNVVAFDSHGQPVGDLTADDFQIQDQGKHQQILFFRANDSHPPPSSAEQQFTNRAPSSAQNATVILLDLLNANLSDRGSGWEGVSRALEHRESGDDVYVYLLTAEAKLFPVHGMATGEVDDAPAGGPWTQRIRPALDRAIRTVNRLKPMEERDPYIRIRGTYTALQTLADEMAAIPGRKNMIWITHGVPLVFRNYADDWVDTSELLIRFATALNHYNIAMYNVDQGGPGSIQTSREGPGYQSQDTLQQLADLTGGHAYPGNNVETAVAAATASLRGSYLIRYEPHPSNWDGKLHKVRVTSARKEIRIQSQQGYYAVVDPPLRASFEAAVTNPFETAGIGLTATVSAKAGARHTLHYEFRIDASDLLLSHQADHDSAQLAIGVTGISSAPMEPSDPSMINVALNPQQRVIAMKEGIPFVHDKVIADNIQKVRITVMDLASGEVGTLTIPVSH